jgi:hypothetical protein
VLKPDVSLGCLYSLQTGQYAMLFRRHRLADLQDERNVGYDGRVLVEPDLYRRRGVPVTGRSCVKPRPAPSRQA